MSELRNHEKALLSSLFTYHAPQPDQIDRYSVIREMAKQMGGTILTNCPLSLERARALERLQEAVFWANAAIAREKSGDGDKNGH